MKDSPDAYPRDGVSGICLDQALVDSKGFTVVLERLGKLALGDQDVAEFLVSRGEVALEQKIAGVLGDEAIGTTWSYLDITPLGRQETWEDSPTFNYPQFSPR